MADATELRRRRGSSAQHATFTGAQGEITVDLTNEAVVVHDGVTPGGKRGAKAEELIASAIANTPAGNIVSTTQQAVNNELDAQRKHINRIINGGFSINQRAYVSGTATSAGEYTFDRWKVTGIGGITFSTTSNLTTVTIPASQALQQVIEGLNLTTGTYTLSWEGTAQAKIGAGSLGDSGVTGVIIGGVDTTIEFSPGTVSNVQLELGLVATPFEYRLDELSLCQKYYYNSGANAASCFGASGTTANTSITCSYRLPVPMRTSVPAVDFQATDWRGNSGAAVTTTAVSGINQSGGLLSFVKTYSSGTMAANSVFSAIASATIIVDDEL